MKRLLQTIRAGVMTAVIEMKSHKLRSMLSMIGVLLGVASLVAMLTLVGGIKVFLNEEMGDMAGTLWIIPREEIPKDMRGSWSRSEGLRLSDGLYLQSSDRVRKFVNRIERWDQCRIAGLPAEARLNGVDSSSYAEEMKDAYVGRGRTFTTDEYENGAQVCLISWSIEEKIHKQLQSAHGSRRDLDLVGQWLTMQGVRFKIIGIIEPDDREYAYWELRRTVLTPIKAVQKRMSGLNPDPGHLEVKLENWQNLPKETSFLTTFLKMPHRGVEDFEIKTADWLEEITSMLNNVSILMTIISAISLFAGGLSIMNVMLSSISERIQEIGTRKALGARNSQIFIQFIVETLTLSVTGGACGVVLGMIPLFFREEIKRSTDGAIVPTILPEHLLFVALVIVFIGILFGLYPAVRAAKMNPIDALRYE